MLLVDDDAIPRVIARESLESAGFDVEEASNGREGVAAFERLRPALVLMDAVMPEMDGFAACAAIRALPGGGRTPILMMTSLDDVESIRHAFEVGATDFATKPVHGSILGFRVGHLIRAGMAYDEVYRADGSNRALLQAIPDLVLRISRDGVILEARMDAGQGSPLAIRELPREGSSPRSLPSEVSGKALELVERVLATGGLHSAEFQLPEVRRVRHLEARVIGSGDSEVVVFLRDITRRRQREGRLAPLVFNDPLTGLPNRARFVQRLEEELARSRRYQERFAVAILRFDLFREFVNEYGENVGGRILRTFAGALSGSLRETDMVARISPNEFGLLLTKLESKYSTTLVVQRILDLLSQGIAGGRDERALHRMRGGHPGGPGREGHRVLPAQAVRRRPLPGATDGAQPAPDLLAGDEQERLQAHRAGGGAGGRRREATVRRALPAGGGPVDQADRRRGGARPPGAPGDRVSSLPWSSSPWPRRRG